MFTIVDGVSIIAIVVLVVAITFVIKAIKVVPQQSAWVVERLGKFHATLQPGLNIVVPFIDRVAYKHSLKEVPLDTPSQVCITKDNTQLQVDGVLYFQVTDPQRASYGASNYILAITQLVTDHAAFGDRQAGARPHLRGTRVHQPQRRLGDRRSGDELGRQGPALRDQGHHAAQCDPALDAAADHCGAREARTDRLVGRPQAGADQHRHRRARSADCALRGREDGADQHRAGRGRRRARGRGSNRPRDPDGGRDDPPAGRHRGGQPARGGPLRRRVRQPREDQQHAHRARQPGGRREPDRVGADRRESQGAAPRQERLPAAAAAATRGAPIHAAAVFLAGSARPASRSAQAAATASESIGLPRWRWNPDRSAISRSSRPRKRGQCDRRGPARRARQGANVLDELQAVLARHADVADDQVGSLVAHDREGLVGRCREQDRRVAFAQYARHQFPRIGLVVDDENAGLVQRVQMRFGRQRRLEHRGGVGRRGARQRDAKQRSLAGAGAVPGHRAAVQDDQVPDDGQAEPESAAAAFARAVLLPEALEQVRQELRLDALALVVYFEHTVARRLRAAEP